MANSMVITVFISFDFVYIPVFIYFSCHCRNHKHVIEVLNIELTENGHGSKVFLQIEISKHRVFGIFNYHLLYDLQDHIDLLLC